MNKKLLICQITCGATFAETRPYVYWQDIGKMPGPVKFWNCFTLKNRSQQLIRMKLGYP